MSIRRVLLLLALYPVVAAGWARAGTTRSWHLTSYKEFEEGEANGVRMSSQGQLVPGLSTTRRELESAVVYSALALPDGSVALGTGDDGEVWQLQHGAAHRVAKLDATLVTSLVLGADGALWAATLPGGKIFAIDLAGERKSPELVTLDAEHVWALAWVASRSTLYAATGPKGRLYAVEVRGGVARKPRLVWDSGEKQLMSLIVDEDGALIVGSSDQAVVYRVVDQGEKAAAKVEALHDFEGDEIRAIARRGRTLYVAVNEFQKTTATPPVPVGPRGTKIALPTVAAATSAVGMPARDRKGKGAVFRLDSDGRVEQLHALGDGYFTALSVEKSDASGDVLWAASGGEGRVYRIAADRNVETAFDVAERQVLTLLPDANGHPLAFGTGDAAAWYEINTLKDKKANYTTKILDGQFTARWGRLRWSGRGDLAVETRSGNTAHADKTWSAWQQLASEERPSAQEAAHGDDAHSGQIASPRARYLQARLGFARASADAVVRDIGIYYVPQNQAPRVVEITVGEEAPHRHHAHSSVLKVRWRLDSSDDDELVYRLYYRELSEPNWRPMLAAGAEPLTHPEFDWATDSLPEGRYVVRVQASDERANPAPLALYSELTSSPALVDNRKPDVLELRVAAGDHGILIATGRARDSYSPLVELSWSLDGGDWQPLLPKDGVCDSLVEEVSFALPRDLLAGPHSLAVRAYDSADNIGAAQINFRR